VETVDSGDKPVKTPFDAAWALALKPNLANLVGGCGGQSLSGDGFQQLRTRQVRGRPLPRMTLAVQPNPALGPKRSVRHGGNTGSGTGRGSPKWRGPRRYCHNWVWQNRPLPDLRRYGRDVKQDGTPRPVAVEIMKPVLPELWFS